MLIASPPVAAAWPLDARLGCVPGCWMAPTFCRFITTLPMKRTTSPEFSTSKRSEVSVVSLVNTATGLSDTTSPLVVSTVASSRCIS